MSDYKLVPVEPTREMMASGGIEMGARDEDSRTVWKAMVAAAPAVQGEPTASPTSGMNLGQRIQHVGGRETERGTVEFGSVMAVEALVSHVLRDIAVQGEPVATIHVDGSFVHVAWRIPAPSRCAMDVYTAPQPAEQQPISAYACTVPDDCETLHWRGQILSMNELVSVAQPAVDEEIHVHIEGRDVLTLPLASSGMSAPRFVVHVPARQPAEQQPAPDVAGLVEALEELMLRAHPA